MGVGFFSDKPRRLGLEEAIARQGQGYTYAELCKKLEEQLACEYPDKGYTVNEKGIAQYVACYVNFSHTRISALATILGVIDTREIDDIYDPPTIRGQGRDWVNRRTGRRIKDFDAHPEPLNRR